MENNINNLNNDEDITYFAETNFRNIKRKFGIKRDDRRRHFYVVGKTGMGKTVALANMIMQDIQRGEGVAVAVYDVDNIYAAGMSGSDIGTVKYSQRTDSPTGMWAQLPDLQSTGTDINATSNGALGTNGYILA